MKSFPILFLFLVLIACNGGFEQDPFVNESENVRNGQIPDTVEKARVPLADVIKFDGVPNLQVEEGKLAILSFKFMPVHPDIVVIDYSFRNLETQLPGAIVDRDKKEIHWTPPVDDLFEGLVDRRKFTLSIFLEEAGAPRTFEKHMYIDVFRSYGFGPTIESVQVLKLKNDLIVEGNLTKFQVSVKDPGVGEFKGAGFPDLFIVPQGDPSNSLSGFMKVDGAPEYNRFQKIFTYTVVLDLKNAEVTPESMDSKVGFFAFSTVSALRSKIMELSFSVHSSASAPVVTAYKNATFYLGQKSTYYFQVFDPKEEGVVEAEFRRNCMSSDSTAVCECQRERVFLLNCSVTWTPKKEGRTEVAVKAINSVGGQKASKSVTHSLLVVRGEESSPENKSRVNSTEDSSQNSSSNPVNNSLGDANEESSANQDSQAQEDQAVVGTEENQQSNVQISKALNKGGR